MIQNPQQIIGINIMEDAVSETSGREDACSVHSHGKDEESKDQNHDERSKDRNNTSYDHRHEDEFDLDGDLSEAEIRERKLMYLVDIEDFAEEGVNIISFHTYSKNCFF
jgi:hypothetical protein